MPASQRGGGAGDAGPSRRAAGVTAAPWRVALVRHPAVAIAPGICYGRRDVGLADGADAAIAAIRTALDGFPVRRIWTSPARRCRAVADALAGRGPAPRADSRLLELDFGAWEGVAWDAVPRETLDRWAAAPRDFAPPGGESGAALIARVEAFAAGLRDGDLVVSHGGPLRVLLTWLDGRPPDLLAPPPPPGSTRIIMPPRPPGR